jgi:hypothetical protein
MPSLPLYATLPFVLVGAALAVGTEELEQLIAKMEQDVVEFAREVEDLYSTRCSYPLEYCKRNNYEHCLRTLPNPSCRGVEEFTIDECNGCGGALFDYTASTVRQNGNPTDFQVRGKSKAKSYMKIYKLTHAFSSIQAIESICYSRQLDQWFQDKRATDASYWTPLDVESPQMHFAAKGGSFRIFPGRRSKVCDYDPHEHPFYIAARSGPKNIVLLLDTSGSIAGQQLKLMKEAAKRVVSTLTVGGKCTLFSSQTRSSEASHPL